jgi:hypothetical protein
MKGKAWFSPTSNHKDHQGHKETDFFVFFVHFVVV